MSNGLMRWHLVKYVHTILEVLIQRIGFGQLWCSLIVLTKV